MDTSIYILSSTTDDPTDLNNSNKTVPAATAVDLPTAVSP